MRIRCRSSLLVLGLVLLSACEERGASHPARGAVARPGPDTTEGPVLSSGARARPPFTTTCRIGFDAVPAAPSPEARRLDRDALTHHREGRYRESLAGFERALAEQPDYDAARFNRACALARLERYDEAREVMRELLCRDLPTYAPKLIDDDLAPIRKSLATDAARLRPRYEAALREGAPMVSYRAVVPEVNGFHHRRRARAVVYLPGSRRIVPIAPLVEHAVPEGEDAMIAWIIDVDRGRAVAITWRGNAAEDPHMDGVQLRAHALVTGAELGHARGPSPDDLPYGDAWSDAAGVFLQSGRHHDDLVTWRVDWAAGVVRRGRAERARGYVRLQQAAWWNEREYTGYRVARGALETPSGPLELGSGHRAMQWHGLRVDEARGVAVASSARWGDCGSADRFVIDVVDLHARTHRRLLEGEGQAHFELGPDGSLYVHLRDRGFRRYPDPLGSDRFEPMPEGLGLSSAPWDFNSYC